MVGVFPEIGSNDPCWCESGLTHGECHGAGPASAPGDPVPEDPPGGRYLSPQVVLPDETLEQMVADMKGQPIYGPAAEPIQRPQRVSELAAEMTEIAARTPTVTLAEAGQLRFEALDGLGLGNDDTLDARLRTLSQEDFDEVVYSTLDLGKTVVERLLEQAQADPRPTVIWTEHDEIEATIGRSLLWADHYLVPDPLFDSLLAGRMRREELAAPVRKLLALRPLIEAGVVVPVPEDLAVVLTGRRVNEATDRDLKRPDLVEWVKSQLVVEGPTARDAIFIHARDDIANDLEFFWLHARIMRETLTDANRSVMSRLLGPYDPNFDYGPWIAQTQRQTTAAILQRANRDLAIADTFGGSYLTRSPFRARLLHRRSGLADHRQASLWVDVPYLGDVDATGLARVLRHDEAVEALRYEVRRAFRAVATHDPAQARQAAAGLVDDLERAAGELEQQIRTDRAWGLASPAAGVGVWVAIGAATGPIGAGAALLAASLGLGPYMAMKRSRERTAAFALLVAKQRARTRVGTRKEAKAYLRPVGPLSAELNAGD
jgi:hypothetical protein